MHFIWNRVNHQILDKFTFRFKSSEKKKYLYAGNFRRTICLQDYFSEKMAEKLRMMFRLSFPNSCHFTSTYVHALENEILKKVYFHNISKVYSFM